MIRLLGKLVRGVLLRPGKLLVGVVLALLIGLGVWMAGSYLWLELEVRAARAAAEQHDFEQAWRHLEPCLRRRPQSPDLHLLKVRLAWRTGRFAEGERDLAIAQRLGASNEAVSLERALLRVQQREMNQDLDNYLRACISRKHPDSPVIADVLSNAYMKMYRLNDARDCLTVWLEDQPDEVEALMRRGWVWERLDQFEKALADYRRAVALAPQRPEAVMRLGQMLLFLGNAPEALEVLERARPLDPDNPAIGLAIAQSQAKLGRLEDARQLLERLVTQHPDEGALLLEQGTVAMQMGEAAAAEPWLRKAAALLPYDYHTHYALAQCLRHLGKDEEAKQVDDRAHRLQQDLERMRDLSERVQSNPYDPALRCEMGKLFLRNGEKREGFLWLRTAVQINPDYLPAHEALAECYLESGDLERAAEHRRQAQGGADKQGH